jgi:DNA polymerase-3 subunit gamma/tau
MSSYTVLARRYRSQTFDDVVGQEHIARTLKAAIETNRVAHAYLFSGTRGVGKTSMARIFAAALAAPEAVPGVTVHEELQSDAPAEVQQRLAQAILAGSDDMDVVEIDGASNRRVEEARDLIAKASIVGSGRSRFKIYIIDEVHMLTREAFNTLLKTMEEPPAHVKFILCTTEPHKVPATIQSRCQRFDFRNIATSRIADHLRAILETEKIEAEPVVIQEIARLGAGSMRDALSLLDRLIAAGSDTLDEDLLQQLLGLPNRALVAQLVDAFLAGDAGAAINKADELLGRGFAIDQVFEVLIEHLRHLLIAAACGGESDLLDLTDDEKAEVARQGAEFDTSAITHMIILCENAQRQCKQSTTARALFDATIARLAMTQHLADLPRLVEALTSGDGRTAAPPAAGRGGRGAGAGAPAKKVDRPDADHREPLASPPSARPSAPSPAAPPANAALRNNGAAAEPRTDPGPAAPEQTDAAAPPPVDVNDPAAVWQRVRQLAEPSPGLMGMISMLQLRALSETQADIVLTEPKSADFVRQRLRRVAEVLQRATGKRLRVELIVDETAADAAPRPPVERAALSPEERAAAEKLPLVKTAMELFNAHVVAVRDTAPPNPNTPS